MTDSSPPKRTPWGYYAAVAVAAAVLAGPLIATVLPGADARSKMRQECVAAVAGWAGVDASSVDWEDVSDENPSGSAWDFRGTYTGGEWACGGPAGEEEPTSVMVYPSGGVPEQINR